MRWLRDGLRPAWPNAHRLPCPWPFGVNELAAWLGLSVPAGPEDGAA
jgi:hypothetical protein